MEIDRGYIFELWYVVLSMFPTSVTFDLNPKVLDSEVGGCTRLLLNVLAKSSTITADAEV